MPEESIWNNLLAYVGQIFQSAFRSPRKILPIQQKPDLHDLENAITVDFLNHWKLNEPTTTQFEIPKESRYTTQN
ncbi:hypothetical protein MJO29_005343 [Puccinia striiformis f. sp. tritici]|nr:hypothetical protein MJO29_005343 [Puccinia striiformis f. sp. tritici]